MPHGTLAFYCVSFDAMSAILLQSPTSSRTALASAERVSPLTALAGKPGIGVILGCIQPRCLRPACLHIMSQPPALPH